MQQFCSTSGHTDALFYLHKIDAAAAASRGDFECHFYTGRILEHNINENFFFHHVTAFILCFQKPPAAAR